MSKKAELEELLASLEENLLVSQLLTQSMWRYQLLLRARSFSRSRLLSSLLSLPEPESLSEKLSKLKSQLPSQSELLLNSLSKSNRLLLRVPREPQSMSQRWLLYRLWLRSRLESVFHSKSLSRPKLQSLSRLLNRTIKLTKSELKKIKKQESCQLEDNQSLENNYTPPGKHLLAFSNCCFSAKLNDYVFEALVAEEQIKHEMLYMQRRFWVARIVRVQLICEFFHEVAKQMGLAIFNRAYRAMTGKLQQ